MEELAGAIFQEPLLLLIRSLREILTMENYTASFTLIFADPILQRSLFYMLDRELISHLDNNHKTRLPADHSIQSLFTQRQQVVPVYQVHLHRNGNTAPTV